MPLYSIGVDLVEIERIERIINRYGKRFTQKIFTRCEIEYASAKNGASSFAARFAAKEAVFKAAGTGLSIGMKWHDVEVVNDGQGMPQIRLYGKTAELFDSRQIHLSLSHTETAAIAMVVVETI